MDVYRIQLRSLLSFRSLAPPAIGWNSGSINQKQVRENFVGTTSTTPEFVFCAVLSSAPSYHLLTDSLQHPFLKSYVVSPQSAPNSVKYRL
ncbi:unnamed protein product [Ceratitis capitata]|uniref:(Mediterranean fruit fly) hypothetical protein n=1 Tax=Ceratitis capitata TaxID=7213 RepID=A0A811V1Z6_CERCA|nr:unnamed protein product [Ceratitis capitata]